MHISNINISSLSCQFFYYFFDMLSYNFLYYIAAIKIFFINTVIFLYKIYAPLVSDCMLIGTVSSTGSNK